MPSFENQITAKVYDDETLNQDLVLSLAYVVT